MFNDDPTFEYQTGYFNYYKVDDSFKFDKDNEDENEQETP